MPMPSPTLTRRSRQFPGTSLAVAVSLAMSASCTATPPPAGDAAPTAWRCGEQRVSFAPDGSGATLTIDGTRYALRQVPAASGARYEAVEDPGVTFWDKGDRALVTVGGEALPECATDAPPPFRARGNEPGWLLEMTADRLDLTLDYGATRLTGPLPPSRQEGEATVYATRAGGRDLRIAVTGRLCSDGMSDIPYPRTVTLTVDGREYRGCGGEPVELLVGDEWTVTSLAGQPPVAGSRVTLRFDGDGRVGGRASCNVFRGHYTLSGESLTVSEAATTMMACAQPVNEQERRFLDLLEQVRAFGIEPDGALVLRTADDREIRARRP
jgi:heat shock protein HslJ/membrane-bound inhibitor of C-type lysozyme